MEGLRGLLTASRMASRMASLMASLMGRMIATNEH
jgi:hypothetical protein